MSQSTQASQRLTADENILIAAKGGGIAFIGTMFEYAGRFVLGFLLARLMGDEQYGLYSLTDSAFYIAIGIASLGLGTATTHFVAIFATRRDEESLWKTIQVGLGLPFLVSLLGGILFFVLANPFAETVFQEPRLAPLLRIVAFAIPAGALAAASVFIILGFKQMQYKVIGQDVSLTMLKLILIVLLAITGLNAIKAMTAYSLAMIASCVLMIYFVNKLFRLSRPPVLDTQHTRLMLGFSLPVYLAELLTMLGPNLGILLLGALNTVSSTGIFTVASRVSMVSTAFHKSIAMMSMPIVSDLHASEEREQLKRFYQTMSKWVFTFNLPFFLLILLFSRPILSIFGESYVSGASSLVILACKDLVGAATGIPDIMIIMTGNTWLNTMNSSIRLVLTLTLSALLIPGWGIIGAATATAATLITISFILIIEVFVLFRLLPYNRGFVKPVIAGILSFAAAYAMTRWVFEGGSLVGTIISMGVLLATYAGAILLLGLSEEDRMVLKRLYGRLSRVPAIARLVR